MPIMFTDTRKLRPTNTMLRATVLRTYATIAQCILEIRPTPRDIRKVLCRTFQIKIAQIGHSFRTKTTELLWGLER